MWLLFEFYLSTDIDNISPYQIASKLKEEKILIPSAYLAQHGEGVNKNKTFKDVYGWGSSTICNLLEKREYLGHTINFKTRKHFKDKKSHYVPEDEWTIFENTHEAIIDQQTFDLVQKIRGNVRRYPDGWGEAAPLTGLLYCADCGGKMYVHRTNNGKRISQYTCSQYSKVPVGKLCTTQHRINEDLQGCRGYHCGQLRHHLVFGRQGEIHPERNLRAVGQRDHRQFQSIREPGQPGFPRPQLSEIRKGCAIITRDEFSCPKFIRAGTRPTGFRE